MALFLFSHENEKMLSTSHSQSSVTTVDHLVKISVISHDSVWKMYSR